MKTDELIAVLGREPPSYSRFTSTLMVAAAALVALALVLTLSLVWLKPRDDLGFALVVHNHVFLLKLVFAFGVVASALPIVRDLSVPGRRVGWDYILAAAPFVIVMLLAMGEFAAMPVSDWSHHVDRAGLLECVWKIPALAVPAFVVLVIAIRRLAPTNLVHVGAYVGLLSGGIGALGYALHCHDNGFAFVALAYSFAIFETAMVGALLGPRVLRWV